MLAPKPPAPAIVVQSDSPQSESTAPTTNGGSSEHTHENTNNQSSPVIIPLMISRYSADSGTEL